MRLARNNKPKVLAFEACLKEVIEKLILLLLRRKQRASLRHWRSDVAHKLLYRALASRCDRSQIREKSNLIWLMSSPT